MLTAKAYVVEVRGRILERGEIQVAREKDGGEVGESQPCAELRWQRMSNHSRESLLVYHSTLRTSSLPELDSSLLYTSP